MAPSPAPLRSHVCHHCYPRERLFLHRRMAAVRLAEHWRIAKLPVGEQVNGAGRRRKRTRIFLFGGRSWTVAALLALAAGCFTAAAPASAALDQDLVPSAKFLPLPEALSAPDEQKLLNEVLQKIATAKDPRSAIAAVDAALVRAPQPTQLRGYLQWVRSSLLAAEDDFPRAVDAIEESVRLLPGYSAPLLGAASLYAYANQPAKAADYFLCAAELDPETARTLDDYEVDNIIRRLKFAREEQRLRAISDRLLEIGWIGRRLARDGCSDSLG